MTLREAIQAKVTEYQLQIDVWKKQLDEPDLALDHTEESFKAWAETKLSQFRAWL